MEKDDIKVYDYELDREISPEEFFEDETPEEIEYYIDLKIHQIIKEIRLHSPYQTVNDTILDSEVFVPEEFYNDLLDSTLTDDELYKVISDKNMEHLNES